MESNTENLNDTEVQSIEQLPEPLLVHAAEDIFTIIYKDGSNISHKNFVLKGRGEENKKEHLQRAIQRCFQFCTKMRYRFVHCNPFITDLDELEKRMESFT